MTESPEPVGDQRSESSPRVIPPEDRYPMWGVLIIPACIGLIPLCILFSGAFWQTIYGAYDHVAWSHGDPRAMPDRSPVLGLIAATVLGVFLFWRSPGTSRRGLVAVLRGALAGAGVYGFLNLMLCAASPLWGSFDYRTHGPTFFWVVLAFGPVAVLAGAVLGGRAWSKAGRLPAS